MEFTHVFTTIGETNMKNISLILLALASAAHAETFIAPTIPGSDARDFGSPGYVISRDPILDTTTITPTIVGNSAPDLSAPRLVIDGDVAYPTVPGTNARDYGEPGFRIERNRDFEPAEMPRYRSLDED
jgi:hypothetical protein